MRVHHEGTKNVDEGLGRIQVDHFRGIRSKFYQMNRLDRHSIGMLGVLRVFVVNRRDEVMSLCASGESHCALA